MNDLVSRQAAIAVADSSDYVGLSVEDVKKVTDEVVKGLKRLPSAQPEIIRCKDCKWRDENWRRVSVRWLPCMDVKTGGNWFCGSAERRTDE